MTEHHRRVAAVTLVEHEDKLLVVWNKRYSGWTLPGGLVELHESPQHGAARELREETGLEAIELTEIYETAITAKLPETGAWRHRGNHLVLFWALTRLGQKARECEPGCPVTYFTPVEFLAWCPFRPVYEQAFRVLYRRAMSDRPIWQKGFPATIDLGHQLELAHTSYLPPGETPSPGAAGQE